MKKIFFSGIGGSGVSAIATFMADKGHVIVGSDRAFDRQPGHPLKKLFESRGFTIVPQDGSGIDNTLDLAVFSTAVEPDHPEFVMARRLEIPLKSRPEYLSEIIAAYETIAVSGTSGKSTASGLLAFLMQRLGLDPNFIGGGRVKQFRTPFNPGNSHSGASDYLIAEACESDGSIMNFVPRYSIILNLALDHHSVDKTAVMFRTLMQNTGQNVFLNADDENLMKMKGGNTVTFSITRPSDYMAESAIYHPYGSEFSLRGTRFILPHPGAHNLYNALSCLALLSETGVSLDTVSELLPEFQGIERRFDILLDKSGKLVIDDYAHNPHKISCLMETVKRLGQDICYIFQPHGFGPTRLMKDEYIMVFSRHLRPSDHLILLPIFFAGGTTSRDISSHDLAAEIRGNGRSVEVIEDREHIFKRIREYSAYVVFGARDETLSDLARELAARIAKLVP